VGGDGCVTMSAERTLLVLRHAKAAGEPGVNDIDRPLTKRGLRDASAAGAWLRARQVTPDLVLCSPAQRTRQTWEQVRSALGPPANRPEVSFEWRIYDGDAHGLLALVSEQPEEAGAVMLVGHNPASHHLVLGLTAREDVEFPTCALAMIRLGVGWASVGPGMGELAAYWRPPSGA